MDASARILAMARNLEPPRARIPSAIIRLAMCALVTLGGCRCFNYDREGAVSPAVAECRRCSHLAIAALERGDIPQAEQLGQQAVKAFPQDAVARRYLAEALRRGGKAEAALVQLAAARSIAPGDMEVVVAVGETHLALDHWEAARAAAEEAIDGDPRSARAWTLRGDTFRQAGRTDEALADYCRALGLLPGDAGITRRLALVSLERRQPLRALAYSQSLLDGFAPADAPADVYDLHGRILAELNRWDDAAAAMSEAVAKGPTPSRVQRLAQAETLAGRGRLD